MLFGKCVCSLQNASVEFDRADLDGRERVKQIRPEPQMRSRPLGGLIYGGVIEQSSQMHLHRKNPSVRI